MPEFVECEHPDLPGQTARLATTALRHLPGWAPVTQEEPDEGEQPEQGEPQTPTARRRGNRRRAAAPSEQPEEE